MGLEIDPHSRQLLSQYVQTQRAKRVITCATQTGWAGSSFVLPDCVIGPSCDAVTYQTGETEHNEHTQAGNLREWKASVSSLAQGNPLIMLAISAAFAGPLLAKVNAESGGIHFVGNSSTGKTTLIETACSIWGGTNYRRSWRATSNGMEGAAALFNDCLLALDEISECDPKDIGAIIYALANGRGKQRSNRSGAARAVTRWRCFVLSTGERTMATAMQDGGQRIKAGQAVRILDIQVNHKHGAFDDLREHTTGAALSDNLKQSSSRYYGTPGRAFLERLTRDERDFSVSLERLKATPLFKSNGGEGQEKRALARFALIALAGELASEYGITGWEEGQAAESASIAYQAWRLERGNGNDERRQIPEQVAEFIERHGDSRFSDADSLRDDVVVRDRAGWWRAEESGGRVYLFTASGLREALKGHDFKQALNALQEAGAIDSTPSGERARFMRINKRGMKLYVIQADKLAGGDHGD
jgi:putative DNA primase/helicase